MTDANGEDAAVTERDDGRLSDGEIAALARRLVAEHVWAMTMVGCVEWEDVPLLVEADWHALHLAIKSMAGDLYLLSRRYDEETGIDSEALLGRVRG